MRLRLLITSGLLAFLFLGLLFPALPAGAQTPVVRAVLFYSPSCSHCHKVMTESLPPLMEQYGDRLEIIAVSVAVEQGAQLFKAGIEAYGQTSGGVPALAVGEHWLVGSKDIPEQLPGIVDGYLKQGGMDWPPIPGLEAALAAVAPAAEATPAQQSQVSSVAEASRSKGLGETFRQDLAGNTLAVIILAGMLGVLGWALLPSRRRSHPSKMIRWSWLIPVLSLVGMGVAAYLAYVEINQVEAVCGPVGDCNTVQQSEYARLFGRIPIGVLGLVGYVLILIFWLFAHFGRRRVAGRAWIAILGLTTAGLLFSIYLTFLEPFVIGASCAWCLTSAVLMTALFVIALAPGRVALAGGR